MKIQTIFAVTLAVSATFAQEMASVPAAPAPAVAPAASTSAAATPSEEEMSPNEKALEKKFEEFRKAKREKDPSWDWGKPDSVSKDTYFTVQYAVELDSTQPEFIKARWFAFEKAYLRAVADDVLDTYGKLVAKTISSEFGDDSTGAEDLTTKPSATLSQKIEMLTEAKVDKALAAEGVPESQYKGKDLVAKRELAHDVLTKNMVKKAIHDSSGCIPVRTYEAFDDKEYRIGVILRSGPQSRSLSKSIRMKKRPMLDGERKSWRELYPTEKDMLNEFGVRLYIDETGTPTLLSFGQFGTSYTGKNKAMRERFEKQAKHQATTLADSKIAEFINSMMDVTDETPEIGMEMQDAISAFSDDTRSREDRLNILDKFRKGFTGTASMDMEGISTAFGPLMVTHPSGHRVALVVRRWSFDRVEAIREAERMEKEADKRGGTVPPPQPKPVPGGSGVRSGATYDF